MMSEDGRAILLLHDVPANRLTFAEAEHQRAEGVRVRAAWAELLKPHRTRRVRLESHTSASAPACSGLRRPAL